MTTKSLLQIFTFRVKRESRINKSEILIIKIGCFGLVLQSTHDVILGPSKGVFVNRISLIEWIRAMIAGGVLVPKESECCPAS